MISTLSIHVIAKYLIIKIMNSTKKNNQTEKGIRQPCRCLQGEEYEQFDPVDNHTTLL